MTENKIDLSQLPSTSPADLAKKIIAVAKRVLKHDPGLDGAGFYSQKQWRERQEDYGDDAYLIVTHDGSDLARFFNWDYEDYAAVEAMRVSLEKLGFYAEQCTSWYTAIYQS